MTTPGRDRLLAELMSRKAVGGSVYTCDFCAREYSGGRYEVRAIGEDKLRYICPACWPFARDKLKWE